MGASLPSVGLMSFLWNGKHDSRIARGDWRAGKNCSTLMLWELEAAFSGSMDGQRRTTEGRKIKVRFVQSIMGIVKSFDRALDWQSTSDGV